jgi:hypothetical protein
MSQFIKLTSTQDNCDLVIVGGDFNVKPDSIGWNKSFEIVATEKFWPIGNKNSPWLPCFLPNDDIQKV